MSEPIMDARELAIAVAWPCQTDKAAVIIESRDAAIRAQERERVIEECKTILEVWHNHDGDRLKQLAQVVAIEKSIHKEPKE
jgi:hypothetical protein